jgi:hypothetical protein
MSTQKHTPGPWHVGFKPGPIVYGSQGEQVANLFEPLIDTEENKANARLIASAPDLLNALKLAEQELYANKEAMHGPEWAAQRTATGFALLTVYKAIAKATA